MVVLGAATPYLEIPAEKIREAIRKIFSRKGDDVIKLNVDAFEAGYGFAAGQPG